MNTQIILAEEAEITVLSQLSQFYEYDFSEFTKDDVSQSGFYTFPYMQNLAKYWSDETKHPFFIKVDGKHAGFILVSKDCKHTQNAHVIDEFFVMRKYRGLNVGKLAATSMFNLFEGEWELRILHSNKPALSFWNKVVSGYTNGNHTFHSAPDWAGYTFHTGG